MIKSLLDSNEIPAEVLGEHLQGAVGEVQAIGMIRVMVDDSLETEARELINEWEKNEPVADSSYDVLKEVKHNTKFSFWSFWCGFVTACFMCLLILAGA